MMTQFVSPNVEIELISHCLGDVNLMEKCILKVPVKFFGSEVCKRIYYEIIQFYTQWDKLPSKVEIEQKIKDFNCSDQENVLTFLDRAFNKPTTNSFDYLIGEVIKKYKSRQLVISIKEATENIKFGKEEKAEEILYNFFNSTQESETFESTDASSEVSDVMDSILATKDSEFEGVATGIIEIDKAIKGLKKQEFGVIVGKTGGFKSTFMINVAINNFLLGKKVAMFVIESPAKQYYLNMYSYLTGVHADALHESRITNEEAELIKSQVSKLSNERGGKFICVDCPQGLTPQKLQMEIRKLKRKEKIDLVIVDYMQIMELEGKSQTDIYDWKSIVSISKMIKLIARAENIPIWSAAQHVDKKHEEIKEHSTEDIAFGKAISHNCDVVLKIFQSPQDMLINQMKIYYLKVRRKARGLQPAITEPNIACMRVCELSARKLLGNDFKS